MKDKGHHTILEKQGEKEKECEVGFNLWISSLLFLKCFFLGCERVFIVIDDYYSEFSKFGQRT